MECDSVHSTIEKRIKQHKTNIVTDSGIYDLATYEKIIRNAKCKQPHYDVKILNHQDFLNHEAICTVDSIRPGVNQKQKRKNETRKTIQPVVTDLKQIRYKENKIDYKIHHSHSWQPLQQDYEVSSKYLPKRLYQEQLPISKAKYEDILAMRGQIPVRHLSFFRSLPHS